VKVLALEPYYGGSHQAFLDGWSGRSRHSWTLLTLPGHHWKWRMRHAPVTLGAEVHRRAEAGETWDVLFCTDMLDLATFLGLAPAPVGRLPSVVYFHENQLTYPVRHEDSRDRHFAFTNLTTALAGRAVWFNSAFHRESFLDATSAFLGTMPDYPPLDAVDRVRARSGVYPPGIETFAPPVPRRAGALRVVWAARWEYDKGPDDFFRALALLDRRGVDFRVSVIGQQFRDTPGVFAEARTALASRIDRWGHQPSRADYAATLADADVFVSTARHEFFGLSAVEAIAAGALPVLPDRLAYPEVLAELDAGDLLYDGTVEALAERLASLAGDRGALAARREELARSAGERFGWSGLVETMDDALADAAWTTGRCREP